MIFPAFLPCPDITAGVSAGWPFTTLHASSQLPSNFLKNAPIFSQSSTRKTLRSLGRLRSITGKTIAHVPQFVNLAHSSATPNTHLSQTGL